MASQNYKDLVIARLRDQSGLPEKKIEYVKWFSIASHYFSQPDHRGGAMIPGTEFHRRDGTVYTFDDVSLKTVLKKVESVIKADVASDRRSEVWCKVFEGIPGAKKKPDWEKPVDNPRADPDTEFSVSRAAPGEVKSNTDIIATLVSAAHLDEGTGLRIGGRITWWDSIDSKGNSGSFSFGGQCKVYGGRLGRNHTLEDVPNHYVRDRVLHYIDNELDEEQRDATRKAVFPDLHEDELEQYSVAIADLERETGGLVMRKRGKKKGNKSKDKGKSKTAPQSKASASKQPSSTLSSPTIVDAAPITEEEPTQAKKQERVSPGGAKERAKKRVKAIAGEQSAPLRRSARLRGSQ